MGGIDPQQLKKLLAKYMREEKLKAGNKIKRPGSNIAEQSLAGVKKSSSDMLKQMISPRPKMAKRGGKIKKKR